MSGIYRGISLTFLLGAIMLAGSSLVWPAIGMLGLCFVLSVMSEES